MSYSLLLQIYQCLCELVSPKTFLSLPRVNLYFLRKFEFHGVFLSMHGENLCYLHDFLLLGMFLSMPKVNLNCLRCFYLRLVIFITAGKFHVLPGCLPLHTYVNYSHYSTYLSLVSCIGNYWDSHTHFHDHFSLSLRNSIYICIYPFIYVSLILWRIGIS